MLASVNAGNPQDKPDEKTIAPLPEISIAQRDEVLEKVGAANESMITIAREEGILTSGIPQHFQEANNIRNQIGQAIRGYGGHSSVSGNNQYECHLISPDLTGVIQRNETARLMLQETQGQKRRLEINDSAEGLRISLSNNEDYFFLFHDRRAQGLVVQESDGDFMFNGHFADFNDFCLRNSDYCQQRLFPLFRRFGVKFPETAYEASVQQLMTEWFLGDPQLGQQLLTSVRDQVLSPEYQQRQAGIKQLMAEYPANRLPLIRLILDEQQSADLRHHLLEALAEHDKELQKTLQTIVLPQNLQSNVPFLVWLLKMSEVPVAAANSETASSEPKSEAPTTPPTVGQPPHPELRTLVRQRLAELTQQPAETPLEQWLEMALGQSDQGTATAIVDVPATFFENSDGFSVIAGKCRPFLQLVSEGSGLRWDREHWKLAFAGRPPREHFEEAREFLKARLLPNQWLVEPTNYKLDEEVQGLVLFERLRPEVKERPPNPNHVYYQNQQNQKPTNACSIDGETLLLAMDMGESPVTLERSPCRLQFAEHAGKKRAIQVVDRPESDFSLTLHSEELGVYVRLQVKSNGETNIRQFQGSQTFQASAATFEQFQKDHPAILAQIVQPTLQLLGSEIRHAVPPTRPTP
jgi:hypothetical protein